MVSIENKKSEKVVKAVLDALGSNTKLHLILKQKELNMAEQSMYNRFF